MSLRPLVLLSCLVLTAACGGSTPPPEAPVKPKESRTGPPPPAGPTRTDFKQIARRLMQECIAGGWISKWRATAKDVDQAKPRIFLNGFEDRTGQNLDPLYLQTELEKQMRVSGVFDIVPAGNHDFIGRGRLLRLAERSGDGRISVYTATLEMLDPGTNQVAYSCEATVKGEM